MEITTKQTQKTNVKARRNGFYLVKVNGKTVGSFEKPWYTSNRCYQVNAGQENSTTHSTKQGAIDNIIHRHILSMRESVKSNS